MKITMKQKPILKCVFEKSGKNIHLSSYLADAEVQIHWEKGSRSKTVFMLNTITLIGSNTEKVPGQDGIC